MQCRKRWSRGYLAARSFPLDNPVKFEDALGFLVLGAVFVPLARTSVPKRVAKYSGK